jgi:RNA polymerase sigma-70 factor (ECF subfamily)
MTEPVAIDALVSRVRAGDAEAFGGLVRAFEWPVRAWITARCPAGADADEVAQLTFVEAFRNIGRYEPGTDFAAWLFTIARYQLMGELTRLRRLADYHERYFPHALALELERRAVSEEPVAEQRLGALRACLAELGEPARRLLDQRYTHEVPLQRIADGLGRSEGAIKKSLFLIRRKLHECLTRAPGAEAGA